MSTPTFTNTYFEEAVDLLSDLIRCPSFSKEESLTASIIEEHLTRKGCKPTRHLNNVYVKCKHYDDSKPTVLLNSHHDTVKPNSGYSNNPFNPLQKGGKLYGLGSNDAGGALVSLLTTFLHFQEQDALPFNLVFAATAEEEISGQNGISALLEKTGKFEFGIVGEPTEMRMATAEKGLMVLDCITYGESGHAAYDDFRNSIYEALGAIHWFQTYQFGKVSTTLGPIRMNVTQINAGRAHNVIPERCEFVVDIRTTDTYTNKEVLDIVERSVDCAVTARSTRLNPSGIDEEHSIIKVAKQLDIITYGSPTLSDQALMNFPTVKIGPGKSERSHTADEFIYLEEIWSGIKLYIRMIEFLADRMAQTGKL